MREPLAVIGMACRLPGADNLDEFWQLVRDGKSSIAEVPPSRLDRELYYDPARGVQGKSYTKVGGIVRDRPFDREACPISEDLIASSDSSHLATLEVATAACRHAGLDPFALPQRNVGVFVGHAHGSPLAGDLIYSTRIEDMVQRLEKIEAFQKLPGDLRQTIAREMVEQVHRTKPQRAFGGKPEVASNAVAGLVTKALGLSGPYVAIDAACASAAYALALASHALQHGRVDMAIVGGASFSSWSNLVVFSQAQSLSAKGSFPFDSRADGFISSDGYVAVIVKTLAQALADQNTIYGVIQGIGISTDGRGKSLWAPRKEGQIEAFRRAYEGGIDPARLQYVEAHSTSTPLGDATEVESLATALEGRLPPGTKIPITSVKANIGHTCEAAGLTALVKTLLAMQHGIIPPAINYETANPQIDWEKVPLFVPTSALEWPEQGGHPRRAAVNAFGIGGLNVHVVVDQRPSERPTAVHVPESHNGTGTIVATNRDQDAVAIIGMGSIFPGARTVAEYWDLLISGRDPKSKASPDRWDPRIFHDASSKGPWRSPTHLGGFIHNYEYDWRQHKIPPKQLEAADLLQFMLLDAADQALRDAGYDGKPFDRRRAGIIVGTIFAGDFLSDLSLALHLPEFELLAKRTLHGHGVSPAQAAEVLESFRKTFLEQNPVLRDETGGFSSSTLASRIAKTLDLMGGACALDAGEASSLAALSAAFDLLRAGTCETVFCAGAQRAMSIDFYEANALRGYLTCDVAKAGFDADASGYVPGEGVGMLLLKRLDAARRDGDPIRAIIRGIDGAAQAGSVGAAMKLAIERTLSSSGISPRNVAMIETAGTGVASIDDQEADAIAACYGTQQRQKPLLLGSVIGQIGHTGAASGLASVLKAAMGMQRDQLPSTFALKQPSAAIAKYNGTLQPISQPVSAREENIRFTGVNAIGLSGLAYHAIIERGTDSVAEVKTEAKNWQIVRIGAPTMPELMERIGRSQSDAASLYAAAEASRYGALDRARLAIVADSPEALEQKLKLSADQLGKKNTRTVLEEQGIFAGMVGDVQPRVAFLFSGQGSQYAGMLRPLTTESPDAAAELLKIDSAMAQLGHASFSDIAWAEQSGLGGNVWLTQASLLAADLVFFSILRSMGIEPDVISAHSYGEYPALVAAGVWKLEQAIQVTHARCKLIEASEKARGMMLATPAPLEVIERLVNEINGIKGALCIANYNAPDQTVIAGDSASVTEVDARLSAEGFESRILPVPCPFHTPLMADVQDPLRLILEKERMLPPTTPVLSSVTNRYVADPEEIRQNLVIQFTRPVLYVDLIKRLARDGISVFVEIGPRQVLTRLHRRILNGDQVIVACDNPKRPGREQLIRVRAALECAGVALAQEKLQAQPARSAVALKAGTALVKPPIIHFDATLRRKQRMRETGKPQTAGSPAEQKAPLRLDSADELESFLVNFVCEQTGYPAEVVLLDADLEADLGIDSIKKAQLFGELREHFNIRIQSTGRLALEDFPTLRHVLDFLRTAVDEGTAVIVRDPSAPPKRETAAPHRPPAIPVPLSVDLNIVRCSGTPYEMGMQHARGQADRIQRLLERYKDMLGVELEEVPDLKGALADAASYFTSAGLDEIAGMADALGRPVEHLVAYNFGIIAFNLGIIAPRLEAGSRREASASWVAGAAGCTQFAITAAANGSEGMIHCVNEDWPLALSLTDGLTRVVQIRQPADGAPHLTFSIAGQLGGINGVNAHGLAVSSTLLLDRPQGNSSTIGNFHSILVKTILERAADIESAIEIVRAGQKIGAWSLCISHQSTDRLCYLEYDGTSVMVQTDRPVVMTTNHSHLHVAGEAPQHSHCRLSRLKSLLETQSGTQCTLEQAKAALRDSYDIERQRETSHPTMNTIKRIDNQVSIVMRPQLGEIWVTPGPLAKGREDDYHCLKLSDVFAPPAETQAVASGTRTQTATEEVQLNANGRTMGRFVLRTVESPLGGANTTAKAPALHGPVLVLGENPTASALSARFEKLGATVHRIPMSGDPTDALAFLDRIWAERPAPHLILATGQDADAVCALQQGDWWPRRRECGLLLPYRVCQHWTKLVSQSNFLSQATLVGVTALGGDFGFSGNVKAVEGGALAGLLKGIRREFEGMLVKIVDVPLEEPAEKIADAVCAELAAATSEAEVGYIRNRRYRVRAMPRALQYRPMRDIPREGTWVVTGGARGITAIVARELGRRFGLKLHLLGTSPAPRIDDSLRNLSPSELKQLKLSISQKARQDGQDPSAAWRTIEKAMEIDATLRAFSEAGVTATYHSCDVSNWDAVAALLQKVRQSDGPIEGIMHGAGIEAASRFDRKQMNNVNATVGAKVDGALALMALTREDPLKYFVAFGSVSGRFGGHGQTDYSLASDMLAKLVHWFRGERPDCASVTFLWPAWEDVGMSVRPETKMALETVGHKFMPGLEGVEHVVDELMAGAPEGEVLILDEPRTIDLDHTMPVSAERQGYIRRAGIISRSPLVAGLRDLREHDSLIAEARFDPTSDRFLREHRFQDIPLLPAVIGLESLAETASIAVPEQTVTALRDVQIVNGLRFHSERPVDICIRAAIKKERVECELVGNFYNRRGSLIDLNRVYVRGAVEMAQGPAAIGAPHREEPPGEWHEMRYPDEQSARAQNLVCHGPSLRCLHRIWVEQEGCWGKIVAPPLSELGGAREGSWIVPGALLDACLVACAVFGNKALGVNQLPNAFDLLRLGRLPRTGEECRVRVTFQTQEPNSATFDFVVWGDDGTVILLAEGYRCMTLSREM